MTERIIPDKEGWWFVRVPNCSASVYDPVPAYVYKADSGFRFDAFPFNEDLPVDTDGYIWIGKINEIF